MHGSTLKNRTDSDVPNQIIITDQDLIRRIYAEQQHRGDKTTSLTARKLLENVLATINFQRQITTVTNN